MSTEGNKEIVRRFYKAFEANDEAGMIAVLSPDLVAYTHGEPGPQSREAMLQGIAAWNVAFGDTRFDIKEQIAEGDKVATVLTMRTKHSRAPYMGVQPTGKQAASDSVSIEYIKDGKIVERRVFSDFAILLQQLGLVPQAAH